MKRTLIIAAFAAASTVTLALPASAQWVGWGGGPGFGVGVTVGAPAYGYGAYAADPGACTCGTAYRTYGYSYPAASYSSYGYSYPAASYGYAGVGYDYGPSWESYGYADRDYRTGVGVEYRNRVRAGVRVRGEREAIRDRGIEREAIRDRGTRVSTRSTVRARSTEGTVGLGARGEARERTTVRSGTNMRRGGGDRDMGTR
jgi:hypothetical protein